MSNKRIVVQGKLETIPTVTPQPPSDAPETENVAHDGHTVNVHPAVGNQHHVVTNSDQTLAVSRDRLDETKPVSDDGYSGFTVHSNLLSNHTCTSCGRPAQVMLKRWDANQLMWARFSCATCANKVVGNSPVRTM